MLVHVIEICVFVTKLIARLSASLENSKFSCLVFEMTPNDLSIEDRQIPDLETELNG